MNHSSGLSCAVCHGFFLGALVVSPGVSAQEITPRPIEEIRVEGKRAEPATEFALELVQYGTQVQLITADEIATGGFTNFGEAAAGLIRGANVGYSPDEGEFTIRIDGGTDRDTLLMVDGVPYFDRSSPLEDIWPATAVDPRMIESVEIYRGGQSLYFGSNAGLGVVLVKTKEPDGTRKGEFGFYGGSFDTRELYGNYSFPLDSDGRHSVMFYGRSYETQAHELFDSSAYSDNVIALGGDHEFPYSFNSLGVKYLWRVGDEGEFRLGYSRSTVDFRDSFPNTTVFQLNNTRFPIWSASFSDRYGENLRLDVEAYHMEPQLENHELDAQVCHIPRLQDLSSDVQGLAAGQGITEFTTAAQFEAFADSVPGLPRGCVTNPFGQMGRAAAGSNAGFYVNEDPSSPFFGQPYGTAQNPFPIGAPMGFVVQSTADFGDGVPTKGFGGNTQLVSGYTDYGINIRGTYTFNEYLDVVAGVQNTSYEDNSDDEFGVKNITVSTSGVYGELRLAVPLVEGLSISVAGRHDDNSDFENQTFWRLSGRQNLGYGLYSRISAGTSYSSPKIDEIGAFGADANINPGLEPQQVEALNLGFGIDGDLRDGSYNMEIGYFETEIDNLFASRQVEDVCLEYADTPNPIGVIEAARRNIIPPDDFCRTAARIGLDGIESVAVNARQVQEIEGYTVDLAFDFDRLQLDLTYTAMDSLEPNPTQGVLARLDGTATDLSFVIPGKAGSAATRQSSERPEWSLAGLVTYTLNDRWSVALNPRWQGPEYAYAPTGLARLVDGDGNRVVDDINFGDYFVLNGSIQYFHGAERRHRFLIRAVNLLGEDYFERASGGAGLTSAKAVVRGEVGPNDSAYYRPYGWNGKPRSFWLQYEYSL